MGLLGHKCSLATTGVNSLMRFTTAQAAKSEVVLLSPIWVALGVAIVL